MNENFPIEFLEIKKTANSAASEYNVAAQAGKKLEIKLINKYEKIFKKLAFIYHTDRGGDKEKMQKLNEANQKCSNGNGNCDDLLKMDAEYENIKNNPTEITI